MAGKTEISRLILADLGFKPSTKERFYHCRNHVDNTPSLSVDLEEGICNCFSCGFGGNLLALFYQERGQSAWKYFNLDNPDRHTRKSFFIPPSSVDQVQTFETLPEVNLELVGSTVSASRSQGVLNFLKVRGLPLSVIDKYGMFYSDNLKIVDRANLKGRPEKDCISKFDERLVIPIYEKNKIVSYEGRDPYFNKKNLPKKEYVKSLYPKGSFMATLFEYEKLDPGKTVYLTEGLMDLFVLQTSKKFKNSTTLFGASVANRQLYLLKKFKKIIYIVNNDSAGFESLFKIYKTYCLDSTWTAKICYTLPPKGCKDIGDITDVRKLNSTIEEQLELGWMKRIVCLSKIHLTEKDSLNGLRSEKRILF